MGTDFEGANDVCWIVFKCGWLSVSRWPEPVHVGEAIVEINGGEDGAGA